ncbi:hypothetical protein LTR64_002797 [Lithohypha guttulata]|uniref:uncharacterized protein n=1 Tax=Lithohypha guttulata TaxID=1690604 RepID=UPI002DE168D1|nr:hypothetical protein LTR51_000978 [Lithohypha guttulata]
MAKKVRFSRTKQHQAEQRAVDDEFEKEQKFLGSAKIGLVHLAFDEVTDREDDVQNEKFLIDSFHRNGCVPLDPMFHLAATMQRRDLDMVLSRYGITSEALLARNPASLPILPLPEGFQIPCLFGRHRTKAAEKVLPRASQWWVVNLYSNDLSTQLRGSLIHQGTNERLRNQGEVFFRILHSKIRLDPVGEDFWWTRLHSGDQRREAERLLSRREYRTVLGALSDIQPLFLDFRTGMIGTILRLKSDDEVLRGFGTIEGFWTSVFGREKTSLQKIDRYDVKTLELRCPAICTSDRTFLEPLFNNGSICCRFSASERDHIWRRLLEYKAFIPSFYSFFENLKYLIAIAETLKRVVHPVYRQTVADAFEEAFQGSKNGREGRGELILTRGEAHGNIAYRHLVLHVMQQLSLLRPESILLDGNHRDAVPPSDVALYELAALADRLGFHSAQIAQQLSQDPDQAAARWALLGARASIMTDCSSMRMQSYIHKIAALFKDFRRNQADATDAALLCTGLGETLDRRSGCPLQKAQEQSHQAMTFAHIHSPDPDTHGEPTALFVRRDIYLFFYGKLDLQHLGAPLEWSFDPRPGLRSSPSHERVDHQGAGEELHRGSASAEAIGSGWQEVETSGSPAAAESVYTDASLAPSEDLNPEVGVSNGGDGDGGDDSRCVRFILHEQGTLKTVHEAPIDSATDIDDRIELLAAGFMCEGLVLMDRNMRTLAPSQCFRSALEDNSMTIYLIRDVDMGQLLDMECQIAGLKRSASDDLLDGSQPRKRQAIGSGPMRYLVA